MTSFVRVLGAAILLAAGTASATTPGPNKHFDCSDSAATSCATDDTGCVPDTKNHLKCGDAIGAAFGKAIRAVIKCHKKQADDRFKGATAGPASAAEDTCEEGPNGGKSAKEKLEAAITKVAGICTATQIANANAEKAVLFADKSNPASLDAQNGLVYCDSTAGAVLIDASGDDAGWVPHSKTELSCADTVGSELGKLAAAVIGCHKKLADKFFAGKDFDENACEEADPAKHKSALEKYTAAMGKLTTKGICTQGCLSASARTSLGASILGQTEAANALVYPCPTTTTTTTTTTTVITTTTTSTTSTTICTPAACSCAGGTPIRFTFSTGIGSGLCGHLESDTDPNMYSLVCGGLYFGGAGVAVPLPSVVPDYGNSIVNVCCNEGGSGLTTLTMHGTSPAVAGGNRCSGGSNHGNSCTTNTDCPGGSCEFLNCTNAGCLYGPPLPVPNGAHNGAATSTCLINSISADATGHLDCVTGTTSDFDLPLTSSLFLTGDLLANRCVGGSTPGAACGGTCSTSTSACPGGGVCTNDTGRCSANGAVCCADTDCPGATGCESGICVGGANNGKGCISTGDCPGGTCRTFIQPCSICNLATLTCNGGPNDGLACTPGDTINDGDFPTSHDCPPPAANIGSLAVGYVLSTGTLTKTAVDLTDQVNVFCGFCKNKITGSFKSPPIPCTSNGDCALVTGFTSCGQKTAAAFTGNDIARTIVETGSPTGALTTGGPPKPVTLVSIFCIPPSYNAIVDNAADLPGPGAVALPGTLQTQ